MMMSGVKAADPLMLTDKSGTTIEVQVEACDGVNVEVTRVSDRKTFTIPMNRLDQESVVRLQEWQARGGGLIKTFGIEVNTGKSNGTKSGDDFDDKRVNLDPVVALSNPHNSMNTCACKMTVVFYGRPVVDRSAMHIFKTITFEIPEIPPGKTQEFKVGKISAAYDNRGYSKFGARYAGYVVVLHDGPGTTWFSTRSVPSSLVTGNELAFLKVQTGKDYDKAFEELELARYSDD
ncbi:hypothetical protein HNR46_002729 [Haloferula luteola]|uniref:Uncharacterized protein n=1 Tax=Haloferula luteola TaxID=595692 RepID=A0A840V4K3_9BACT|nr:hypothetical protein [Haloferula luteola]MBB5352483.1 hypothetical protein [Haloferula luteola]